MTFSTITHERLNPPDLLARLFVEGDPITTHRPGVLVGHLNGGRRLPRVVEEFPSVSGITRLSHSFWEDHGTCYWVADSVEQFLKDYGVAIEAHPRPLALYCTHIPKKGQPRTGGWRWHKWGEYVGRGEPTTEYLYDEPGFAHGVYVIRAYETEREGTKEHG